MNADEDLKQLIEKQYDTLFNIFCHYWLRAGLGEYMPAAEAAPEIINDVVVEAMSHPDRLRTVTEPIAWLIGIGANIIKRRRDTFYKQAQREPLARDLYTHIQDDLSDAELFDHIHTLSQAYAQHDYDARELVQNLLSFATDDDRHVLEQVFVHGLSGDALAKALGVKVGAARVRLHRAIHRLRTAFTQQKELV